MLAVSDFQYMSHKCTPTHPLSIYFFYFTDVECETTDLYGIIYDSRIVLQILSTISNIAFVLPSNREENKDQVLPFSKS